jgi:hypothetical protein
MVYFADGSSWLEVIPRLQAAGLNVTSVQNPLTTQRGDLHPIENDARRGGRCGVVLSERGVVLSRIWRPCGHIHHRRDVRMPPASETIIPEKE